MRLIGSTSIDNGRELRLWKTQKRDLKFRRQNPPAAAIQIVALLYCLSSAARKKLAEMTLVLAIVGENLRSAAATRKSNFQKPI